jgi:hypothetical protein
VTRTPEKLLQNLFSVILNVVRDLRLTEKTRFFAPLRMTLLVNQNDTLLKLRLGRTFRGLRKLAGDLEDERSPGT